MSQPPPLILPPVVPRLVHKVWAVPSRDRRQANVRDEAGDGVGRWAVKRKRDGSGRVIAWTSEERIEHFWSLTRPSINGCIEWTAHIRTGYGQFWSGSRHMPAHRFAYEQRRGPVPSGFVIDHLCRNRRCVNPDHMEVVTQRENVLRGDTIPARNSQKTRCKSGHLFAGDNVRIRPDGSRRCVACTKLHDIERPR
jgi:hypothetical protein